MKKTILFILLSVFLFPLNTIAQPQDPFAGFADIDSLMEDNALTDAANRYGSALLAHYPERATLLGFESSNGKLDQRTPSRDTQALNAFKMVEESLNQITPSKLSASKLADYEILKANVTLSIWNIENNQNANNPLYYAQSLDSIYDLTLKRLTGAIQQDQDISSRAIAASATAQQAASALSAPAPLLAQIATEKAYYAYLAYDDIINRLTQNAEDDVTREQIAYDAQSAKKNIKALFETFKKLTQENSTSDFRLGADTYNFILANQYFIPSKKLDKTLEKNFKEAQTELKKTLEPFAQQPAAANDEIMVIDDLNTVPTLEAAAAPITQEPKKVKKGEVLPPSAQDFYAAARSLQQEDMSQDGLLTQFAQDAAALSRFFTQNNTLPVLKTQLSVRPMPVYFAYTQSALFVPPYGAQQLNPGYDFYLRLPAGNALNKQAMLTQDFNEPTRKLILTSQLIPGRYFQAASSKDTSALRRIYPVPTLQNGWSVYAQQLAKETGYIVTDQELLYLAWADYTRAAQALLDYKLHTKEFSYAQAEAFLVQDNGFDQTEADSLLKNIAAQPGEAVSYIAGYQTIADLRAKYQKKLGKKFSLSDFHAKLLSLGAIPPSSLEREMERAYQQD